MRDSRDNKDDKSKEAIKRSYVNLESSFSPSLLSQSFAGKVQNQTFCEPYNAVMPNDQTLNEHSILSIENMLDTSTAKSGKSARRSRKDRSGYRGTPTPNITRKAVTPHMASSMTMIKAKSQMAQPGVSPNVRQMPGSDAISLELNIKGMTEPNRAIPNEDSGYNQHS